MVDFRLRQLERKFSSTRDDFVADELASVLKRSEANPSNATLANLLLISYMRKFDVPYTAMTRDGDIVHRIPLYKPENRRGCTHFKIIDSEEGVRFVDMPPRRSRSRFDEPEYIHYRAPSSLGRLLSSIDKYIVPNHDTIVETILPMFDVAAEEAGAELRVDDHYRGSFRDYNNPKSHHHTFKLMYGFHDYRCTLVLNRVPPHDLFEFRINENINYGDGWEVLDLALSGTRYQEVGFGGWDVQEDEDDLDLHDYDTVLGPGMMQERINFYIDEMRNNLRIR